MRASAVSWRVARHDRGERVKAPWSTLPEPPIGEGQWFTGRTVTVMGLGQWGGGLGVVQWLVQLGARVCLTDQAPEAKLMESLRPLAGPIADGRVRLRLGGHHRDDFTQAELVVANAAVPQPWANEFLKEAASAGVPVTTEIRLALGHLNAMRVVGITGSAGKSTTTAMTALALRASGRHARIGGNFGGSLLGGARAGPDEWIVLELSSAQLWWLSCEAGGRGWSPAIGVLTNIAPNHLDWHGSLTHYSWSKGQIRRDQGPTGIFLSSFADEHPSGAAMVAADGHGDAWWARPSTLSEATPEPPPLSVPGEHQRRNARLALAILGGCAQLDGAPTDTEAACAALAAFGGLDHRLQFVGEFQGVRCYNDSKATTPEATLLAISSLADAHRIHLIAGGYDKKIDLSPISALAPRLAGLYGIGATQEEVARHPSARRCTTLECAVETAMSLAKSGDLLLLSPGCASWDQFTNFEARGKRFVELLRSRAASDHC